jgi:hypothetical protein
MTISKVVNIWQKTLIRYTASTPDDVHTELIHAEAEEHAEEPEDDYTPLDPAYLPPGLEEETSDKDISKGASENNDEVSGLL